MKDEFITKQQAREAMLTLYNWQPISWSEVKRAISAIPSKKVVPIRKAFWYGESDGYADGNPVYDIWSCPLCGKYFDEWEEKPTWNFCPNCGADMREDEE